MLNWLVSSNWMPMIMLAEEREKIEVKTNSWVESFILKFLLVLVCGGRRRNKFQSYGGNDVSISLIGEDIGNTGTRTFERRAWWLYTLYPRAFIFTTAVPQADSERLNHIP